MNEAEPKKTILLPDELEGSSGLYEAILSNELTHGSLELILTLRGRHDRGANAAREAAKRILNNFAKDWMTTNGSKTFGTYEQRVNSIIDALKLLQSNATSDRNTGDGPGTRKANRTGPGQVQRY